MLVKNILESLAKKAKLQVKGHPDNRLLRFTRKDGVIIVFVVSGAAITGYRTYWNKDSVEVSIKNSASMHFNLCNPDSLCKILTFMNNDD